MKTCWQIREGQEFGTSDNAASEWLLNCADCAVRDSGYSCWEQSGKCPYCCAPIHISCDFCVLYIEHRREIAALARSNGLSAPDEQERLRSQSQGGRSVTMDRLQVKVPLMYGDHHVLKARAALTGLRGVQDVVASAAFHTVAVTFDPALISVEEIHCALSDAGYPVEVDSQTGIPLVPVAGRRGDPAWDRLGVRISRTDSRDAKANR